MLVQMFEDLFSALALVEIVFLCVNENKCDNDFDLLSCE